MADRQIRYGIGFDVDKTGLQEVRTELKSLQGMSLKQLQLIDKNATKETLKEIQEDAKIMGDALEKSFNPKLNTINLQSFNQSLAASGKSIKDIEAGFAKAGIAGQSAFRNMTAQLFTTQKAVKQTSNFIDSMAKTLFNTIKWSIASSAINTVTGAVQKAWGYTKSLDASLNDIRIVTEKSAEDMDKFAVKANKAAKALGAATTAYTKASLIYYQQGLDEEDVQARTDVTIKAANVTGQSAAEVSEQLTAVWNGYKVVADEAESYIDKLSAVAATTASDLEELSEGMAKVASGANAMGVDIDQLTAQLSTIISVTRQDASSVGTALKTIFARMGDLKVDGVDEFGVSLGEVSGTLKQVGIDVLDQEGNLRDMGVVMEEVAGKWGTWTEAQQQAIAVAMAGKRQYNNLLALFENWDMYESALTTSKTSEGTLQKQQDIFMDSLEAKLQQIGTSAERVYKSLFDSESMKDFLDVLSVVIDGIGSFIDGIGGGGNLLFGIVSLLGNKWKNEIAIGIGRAAQNMGVLKENTIQNQAETEIMAKYEKATGEPIEKMVALKKEQLKANKYLTDEEKEQYDTLILQTAELYNQRDALDQQKKAHDAFVDENLTPAEKEAVQNGSKTTIDVLKEKSGKLDSMEDYDSQQSKIKQQQNIRLKAISDISEYQNALDSPSLSEERKLDIVADEGGAQQKKKEANAELDKIDKSLIETANDKIKTGKLEAEVTKELTEAINALIEAKERGESGDKERLKLDEKLAKAKKKSKDAFDKETKAIKENSESLDTVNRKIKDNEKLSKSMTKNVQFKAIVSGVSGLMTSAGMATTALVGLNNALKDLFNPDLTTGEKLTQFFSSFLYTVPMIISAFSGMKTAVVGLSQATGVYQTIQAASLALTKAESAEDVKAATLRIAKILGIELEEKATENLTKEEANNLLVNKLKDAQTKKGFVGKLASIILKKLEKKATEGETEATIQATLANYAFQASLGVIGVIILAIVAAVAILILVFSELSKTQETALQKAQKNLEKEQKALEELNNNYKELNEELNNLKTSFDELEEKQKILEDLTVGTKEWSDALRENNLQILELLDKYPQLAEYINTNETGVMSITQEGKDKVEAQLAKDLRAAESARLFQQTQVLKAKNNVLKEQSLSQPFYLSINKEISASEYTDLRSKYLNSRADNESINRSLFTEQDENGNIKYKKVQTEKISSINEIADNKAFAQIATLLETSETEADFSKKLEEAINNNSIQLEKELNNSDLLATALYKNKDSIYENSLLIDQNNKVIAQMNQQMAASFFAEDANRRGTENVAAFDKMAGAEIAKKTEETKYDGIQYDKYDAHVGITEEAKGAYARALGVNVSELEIKNGRVKIKGQDGDGLTFADVSEIAMNQIAKENYDSEKTKNKINTIFNAIDEEYGKGLANTISTIQSGTSGDIDTSRISRNSLKDFDEAAEASFEALKESMGTDDNEAVAKALNFDSYADYVAAVSLTKKNIEKSLENATKGLYANGQEFDIYANYDNMSIDGLKAVSAAIENAFKTGGTKGVTALQGLLSQFSGDPETQEKIANIASGINFSEEGAFNKFLVALEKAGIKTDEISETNMTNLANSFDAANIKTNSMIANFEKIKTIIKDISDIAKDLTPGEIIDEEEYEKLTDFDIAFKDLFIMTAEGYKFIGNSNKAILDKIYDKYQDADALNNINQNYANFISAQEEFDEKTRKDIKDATTDASKIDLANDYKDNENFLTMVTSQGNVSEEAFKAALAVLSTEGIDTSSTEYVEARDIVTGAIGDVQTGLQSYDEGTFNQNYLNSQEMWATATSRTLEEIEKAYSDEALEETVYNKAIQSWTSTFASQLGLQSDALIHTFGTGIDGAKALQAQIKRVNKLEQERYADIENELERLDVAINNTFGEDKIGRLAERAQKNFESVNIAEESFKLASDNAASYDKYVKEVLGLVEGYTIADLQNAQLNHDQGSDEWNDIQVVIDAKQTANDLEMEFTSKAEELKDSLIEIFNTTIELRVDFSEAKQALNEFKTQFNRTGIDLFRDNTGSEIISSSREQYDVYKSDAEYYKNMLDQLGVFKEDGSIDPTYLQNEEVLTLIESYQEAFEGMHSSIQEALEGYNAIQEEIFSAYEEQIDKISNINDLYKNSISLLQIIGGRTEKYATNIRSFFAVVENQSKKSFALAQEQLRMAQEAYTNDYELATEEQKRLLEENLNNAAAAVLDTANSMAEAAAEKFKESFKLALDKALGESLEMFSEDWERDLYFDERYLDEVNKAYNIDELERKIQKSIDGTDSYSAQKKLNQLKQQEINILRAKDKLTQADLDRANARYELELKRIALEEAQQTASKMKLTRDASGNYSYQYVSDLDAISEAEAEYKAAENELYNLNKDQEKETVSELISKYQEAVSAIGDAQTKEEKQLLYDYYFGNNGVIALLEKDLEAIVGENNAGVLGYTSQYKDTVDKLMKMDKTSIETSYNDLLNGIEGQTEGFADVMENLTVSMDTLFGKEGALTTAISDLKSTIQTTDKLDFSTDQQAATNLLKDIFKLPENGGVNSSIAATLEENAATILALLQGRADALGTEAANENTNALNKNTNAIEALTNAFLLQNIIADGKIDSNEFTSLAEMFVIDGGNNE